MEYFQYSYAGICECFKSSLTDACTTEAQKINRVYQKISQIILNSHTNPINRKMGVVGI